MCVRARSSARVRVCECVIIEKKSVHAAEDAGSAEEEKNKPPSPMVLPSLHTELSSATYQKKLYLTSLTSLYHAQSHKQKAEIPR